MKYMVLILYLAFTFNIFTIPKQKDSQLDKIFIKINSITMFKASYSYSLCYVNGTLLKINQKTSIWSLSGRRRSSSIVRRKMNARKRAVAEKKCHMSWLSKKSRTWQSSFLFLQMNLYLHKYNKRRSREIIFIFETDLDSGGVLFLD